MSCMEHLLDDDEDMAEMYLTDKLVQLQLESSSASSINDGDNKDNQLLQPYIDDRIPPEISLEAGGGTASYEDHQNSDNSRDQLGRDSHGTHASTTNSAVTKQFDVKELYMLLAAYSLQIDGTLNTVYGYASEPSAVLGVVQTWDQRCVPDHAPKRLLKVEDDGFPRCAAVAAAVVERG